MQALKDCGFSFLFADPTKCLFWMSFLLGKHFCTWKYFQRFSEFYSLKTDRGYYFLLKAVLSKAGSSFVFPLIASISVLVFVLLSLAPLYKHRPFIDVRTFCLVKAKERICTRSPYTLLRLLQFGLWDEEQSETAGKHYFTPRLVLFLPGCWILAAMLQNMLTIVSGCFSTRPVNIARSLWISWLLVCVFTLRFKAGVT